MDGLLVCVYVLCNCRSDLHGQDALLDAFVQECKTVRKALSGDFAKVSCGWAM